MPFTLDFLSLKMLPAYPVLRLRSGFEIFGKFCGLNPGLSMFFIILGQFKKTLVPNIWTYKARQGHDEC